MGTMVAARLGAVCQATLRPWLPPKIYVLRKMTVATWQSPHQLPSHCPRIQLVPSPRSWLKPVESGVSPGPVECSWCPMARSRLSCRNARTSRIWWEPVSRTSIRSSAHLLKVLVRNRGRVGCSLPRRGGPVSVAVIGSCRGPRFWFSRDGWGGWLPREKYWEKSKF